MSRSVVDRSSSEERRDRSPLSIAIFALSIIGVLVSAYLTYAHFTEATVLACPETGIINCAKVTTSAQSHFLGMPVSVLGLVFYIAFAALNFPSLNRTRSLDNLRLSMSGGSVIFILWLIYAELVLINNICLWCSVVHVVTLVIFFLNVYRFTTDRA
ncbi:MAG: vitamin K epoxide reductase family protein [Actinomycetota bacterium]|nr:vitamin K epoxide reductase family protein [Actinomycetota bacterium]